MTRIVKTGPQESPVVVPPAETPDVAVEQPMPEPTPSPVETTPAEIQPSESVVETLSETPAE